MSVEASKGQPPTSVPAARPLEGTVVLDFSRFLPGPMAAQMLVDLGADAIKIEGFPAGDPIRANRPPTGFRAVNRGKKSLHIDFATERGREVVGRLLEKADVLIESSRPGSMAAFGLDHQTLRASHPSLVYCSVSAFGQSGPYADTPGHGLNIDAMSGMLAVHVDAEGFPFVPRDYPYIGSLLTAHATAMGICAALVGRARTGQGAFIDASCWDCSLAGDLVVNTAALNGADRAPLGSRQTAKYAPYRTRDDRYLMVCAIEPKFWRRFCEVLGRTDLTAAFDKPGDVHSVWGEGEGAAVVYDEVAAVIATRTLTEWEAAFAPTGLPVAPVKTRQEAMSGPHAAARALVQSRRDEAGGTFRTPGPALMLDGERHGGVDVPALGANNGDVLASLGYTPAEIADLRTAGVLGGA